MKPYPIANADTAPFWEGCNQNQLLYQICQDCEKVLSYPRGSCTFCHSKNLKWYESSKIGKVASYTIVHRGPSKAFKPDQPYLLVLVDLKEGFRLMMNLLNCDLSQAKIGLEVQIIFEERGPDGQQIPQCQPYSHKQ